MGTGSTTKAFATAARPPQTHLSVLQRKCACGQHAGSGECEECKKKKDQNSVADPLLQRSALSSSVATKGVPPIVHEVLRSPGQPLDAATRSYFEPRFGHDFSQVRVHDGERAAASAKAVRAAAYTVGKNLVFGCGRYEPGSDAGKKLLAHELTHVMQQESVSDSWQGGSVNLGVGEPNDAFEQQATQNEQLVESRPSAKSGQNESTAMYERPAQRRPVVAVRLQRDLDDPSRFSTIHEALFVTTSGGGTPQAWKDPTPGEAGTAEKIKKEFKTKFLDWLKDHPMATGGYVPTETTKDDADTGVVAADKIIRARFPQISTAIPESKLKDAVSIITDQQTSDPDYLKQFLTNRMYGFKVFDDYAIQESDSRFQKMLDEILADGEIGPKIKILASRVSAYTTGEGASRKVALNRGLDDKPRQQVLLHELVHFYVHPTFKDWINQSTAPRIFDEGFTEYLSRLAMTKDQLADAKGYQNSFDLVKSKVAANASDDDIARAYFSGEVWLLEGKTDVSKKALETTGLKSKVTPKEEREESKTSDGIAETVVPGSHYRFMNLGNEESEPKPEHKALFAQIQRTYLSGHPGVGCRFVGHASSPGTDSFNMALSLRRAQAFYQMARDAGVPDSQLVDADKPQHFGETKPTAPNEDVRGRAFNRRVELFLIPVQPAGSAVQQASAGTAEPSNRHTNASLVEILRSPGESLDFATRRHFESRFNTDFSHVRVHADARAAESALGMNALAYATGSHVAFAAGQYNPKSLRGRQLLAHELTHVAQQSRSSSLDASATERAERQAAENARRFPMSEFLPSFEPAPRNTVMRQDKDASKDGSNQTQTTMTRAQFEGVMKRKFRVSSIRTGTFADQRFGDMKESDWEAWPTSSSEAPYSLILDAINSVVATLGGMPPVQEIIFFKVDWERDSNSQGSIPHAIRVPGVGASFALGRLQIFEGVSKGNAMLNLKGNFQSPTTEQAVRRNITHELGHSIVEEAMNQANRPGIDPDIMSDYKFAAGWFRGPLAGDPEMLYDAGDSTVQAAVINRKTLPVNKRIFPSNVAMPWKERPLTGYGADNPGDDFAEAFMAYVNEPAVLKKFAPRRFEFIDTRKSRWASRMVKPNQPASANPQQQGALPGQNRGSNLPLRKDFNKEMEKSLENLEL